MSAGTGKVWIGVAEFASYVNSANLSISEVSFSSIVLLLCQSKHIRGLTTNTYSPVSVAIRARFSKYFLAFARFFSPSTDPH